MNQDYVMLIFQKLLYMMYPQNSIILLHTQKTSIVRVCVCVCVCGLLFLHWLPFCLLPGEVFVAQNLQMSPASG